MITEEESRILCLELGYRVLPIVKDQPVVAAISALGATLAKVLEKDPRREFLLSLVTDNVREIWKMGARRTP